ncbi:hypothetical protein [Melioribacter sp. OK-6-Me]|uniref:hypothetical protein n=1 Tax=unclassified Melioribacter TaxID=2627329 RepID=UPI003ED9FAEC
MKLTEIFLPESFHYKYILEDIRNEKLQTPVVMINNKFNQQKNYLREIKKKK